MADLLNEKLYNLFLTLKYFQLDFWLKIIYFLFVKIPMQLYLLKKHTTVFFRKQKKTYYFVRKIFIYLYGFIFKFIYYDLIRDGFHLGEKFPHPSRNRNSLAKSLPLLAAICVFRVWGLWDMSADSAPQADSAYRTTGKTDRQRFQTLTERQTGRPTDRPNIMSGIKTNENQLWHTDEWRRGVADSAAAERDDNAPKERAA